MAQNSSSQKEKSTLSGFENFNRNSFLLFFYPGYIYLRFVIQMFKSDLSHPKKCLNVILVTRIFEIFPTVIKKQ